VTAVGDVALLQPSGVVTFADEVVLSDGLRNGFISGIRVLLSDRSRMVGVRADRIGGTRTEIINATFTACVTCAGDPSPPVWQVKAARVIHNEEAQRIDYHDARLELFGIPVMYTPFFSHPDETARRQSGFLTPSYASSSHLGVQIEVPYYFDLAPHRDFTFSPVFTSREGVVLAGEYRERTQNGQWSASGSLTNPYARDGLARTSERDVRGHIRADGEFRIDDIWRWGFVAARSSDDTYLRRYDLSEDSSLTTNVFVEGIDGRTYAAVNAWAFQGLREDDDPGQTPLVLPMIDYSLVSPLGPQGQTVRVDANAMALTRNDGPDSWRLSVGAAWRLPYAAPLGDVYTLSASLRGDVYYVSGVEDPTLPPSGPTLNGLVGRALPQVALEWRLPLVRTTRRAQIVVEPVAALIVAPYGGNPDKVPNEDSLSFEFDDANLFSPNRFPGLDRWEGGPRLNAGVLVGTYGARSVLTGLVGQTLRLDPSTQFDDRSGLRDSLSDYVGRVTLTMPNFEYVQRFRVDSDSFSLRRNEISLGVGPDYFRFKAGYVFLSEELSTENLGRREELTFRARAPVTDAWHMTVQSRHDLTDDGGLLLSGVGLVYECDCMTFSIDFVRRLTRDRDVPPSTAITARLRLRHLG
jgi:LPS-assembly protein